MLTRSFAIVAVLTHPAFAADNAHPETGEVHTPMFSDKMVVAASIVPAWPEGAEEDGSTVCTIRAFVDTAGTITASEVSGCDAVFEAATQLVLPDFRFEPVEVQGEAVPVVTTFQMGFTPPKTRPSIRTDGDDLGTTRHPADDSIRYMLEPDAVTVKRAKPLPEGCGAVVFFDADGWFEAVRFSSSCPDPGAATKSVKKFKIAPYLDEGDPLPVAVRFPVGFAPED